MARNSKKAIFINEGDGTKRPLIDSLGREHHAIFINESGRYETYPPC